MLQVAATVFSVDPKRVQVHSTNTFRIANTSPSAASATADLNGKAVQMACDAIVQRLKPVAAEMLKTQAAGIELKEQKISGKEKPH